jgi:hypothetical protein
LHVDGEISTKYIKLTESAIVDVTSFKTILSVSEELRSNLSPIWRTYTTPPCYDLLTTKQLTTVKGVQTYLDNIPIKLKVYVELYESFGAVKGYYELRYDGQTIYTSPTKGYLRGIYFDDEFDFYKLTTPHPGGVLDIVVHYIPAERTNSITVKCNISVSKTLFIVQVI